MKRILFLLTLLFSIAAAHAVTLTGKLINGNFSSDVSGYTVYRVDSNSSGFFFADSVVTGSTGTYSFIMPGSFTSGRIKIQTSACGRWFDTSIITSASAPVLDLHICPYRPAVTYIRDTVRNSTTNLPVFGQKVYLMDSSAMNYVLDSAVTGRDGVAWLPVSSRVHPGVLRIFVRPACGIQSQNYTWTGALTNNIAPTLYTCASSPMVTGRVTNTTTGQPALYFPVEVIDSLGTVQVSKVMVGTDANGDYSVTLPGTSIGHKISTSAIGCGNRSISGDTLRVTGVTNNLGICASSSATISGKVYIPGTTTPVSGHKLYLIDTISTTSIYIDSVTTGANGAYSFNIPAHKSRGPLYFYSQSCGVFQLVHSRFYVSRSDSADIYVSPGNPATFSGAVYNFDGSGVGGLTVTVSMPGSVARSVSTITAANGTYSLTIPCTWPTGGSLHLYTGRKSCGSGVQAPIIYSGINIVRYDTVCPATNYALSGIVRKQGGGVAAGAKVWVIEQRFDSLSNVISLYAIDSGITSTIGRYFFGYTMPLSPMSINPNRGILIKAALQSTDPAYSSVLPTYLDTALSWSTAHMTKWWSEWHMKNDSMNITLRAGVNPGGPGFIGGNVLLGANKSSAVGDALPGRILILSDLAGNPVAFTYSDGAGSFSFPSLAYGSYYIYGDAGGLSNPKLRIDLSASRPRISDVIFDENSTAFAGRFSNVSVDPDKAAALLSVYPNPAGNNIQVQGLAAIAGAKTISIRNLSGALMARQEVPAGREPHIGTESLAPGMYMLEIRSEAGVHNLRFMRN